MIGTRWNVFRWDGAEARTLLSVHRSLAAAQRAREAWEGQFPGEVYVEGWKGRGASWDARAKPRRAGVVGCGRTKEGGTVAKLQGAAKAAFLKRMAKGRAAAKRGKGAGRASKASGSLRTVGAAIKRGAKRGAKRVSKALATVRGSIGSGTPAKRLTRVESAVVDLARAQQAVVNKVVEHEQRLNRIDSTLSAWVKGRR